MTFSETPVESCFAVSSEESAGRPRLHIAALAAADIMRPIQPSSHWADVASTNTRPALCGNDSHVLALFVCPGPAWLGVLGETLPPLSASWLRLLKLVSSERRPAEASAPREAETVGGCDLTKVAG